MHCNSCLLSKNRSAQWSNLFSDAIPSVTDNSVVDDIYTTALGVILLSTPISSWMLVSSTCLPRRSKWYVRPAILKVSSELFYPHISFPFGDSGIWHLSTLIFVSCGDVDRSIWLWWRKFPLLCGDHSLMDLSVCTFSVLVFEEGVGCSISVNKAFLSTLTASYSSSIVSSG